MRYVFKMEAIGDSYAARLRYLASNPSASARPSDDLARRLGDRRSRPWVARVVGFNRLRGFQREFISGQKDYETANGTGSRGIRLYYFLEPGLYEINQRETWKRVHRYFAAVLDESTLIEISGKDTIRCLERMGLA